METRFRPPKSRRNYFAFEVITLSLAASVGLFLVALGTTNIIRDPSNWLQWLYTIWIAVMVVWASLIVHHAWIRLHHGILVQDQGLTIFGIKLTWGEIMEMYTNPNEDYITLRKWNSASKPPILYFQKEDISQLGLLMERIREFGVSVKDENYKEQPG